MLIAIIDDGIDIAKLLNHNLKYDLILDNKNEIRDRDTGNNFLTPHGTTCARIIEKYAPKAEFISICVFQHSNLKTNSERLFVALNWCLEKRIQLIHMSVGTDRLQDSLKIRPVIARMLMQGQIIVSAGSNKGSYTIPACLGGVIGVIANEKLKGFSYHRCYSAKGILLSASSRHTLTDSLGNILETDIANSYAAPTVTAAVHNFLMDREPNSISVPSLYHELIDKKSEFRLSRPDFIENAYVLNLSGRKLINERCFFSIAGEYTVLDKFEYEYKKGNSLVYLPSIDIKENKKVFNFMKSYQNKFKGILYAGRIEREFLNGMEQILIWNENDCGILRWDRLDKDLEKEECPTIFIYDDGRKGIDLSCNILKLFQDEGYQCLCVSNQEFSYLYGFEYFPQNVTTKEVIQYVNDIYEPDLIIFCTINQSIIEMIEKDVNNYIVVFGEEKERKEENMNQSVMTYPYDKSDLEKLFQHIMAYFS